MTTNIISIISNLPAHVDLFFHFNCLCLVAPYSSTKQFRISLSHTCDIQGISVILELVCTSFKGGNCHEIQSLHMYTIKGN